MSPRRIKNFAISYIAQQLENNPEWLRCITDSWIYDAENWFLDILEKQGIKIFTNDTDYEYTEEVETIVHKFWGFVQKEKDRKYEELYGERDAFRALPGMIRHIKEVREAFALADTYYVQDRPTRRAHINHIVDLLTYAINEMEDLRIKSKEK